MHCPLLDGRRWEFAIQDGKWWRLQADWLEKGSSRRRATLALQHVVFVLSAGKGSWEGKQLLVGCVVPKKKQWQVVSVVQ